MTRIAIDPGRVLGQIDRNVFGGFVEHLGRCIYGGLYEEGSPLSDERGFRTDVLSLLRDLRMGVLRWPGGNFVSNYHWQDGIGPKDELGILGTVTANAGSREEAKTLIAEAAGMFRRLAADNPTFAPEVARLLLALAWMSMDTPAGMEQARAAVAEATGILEPLAEQGHDVARIHLEAASPIRILLGEPTGTKRRSAETVATLSFRQAALGGTVRLRLTGVPRTVTARLPKGVHDGQQVRLRGQGMPAGDGGPPGDLYVRITVEPDEVFSRNGHNLTLKVPLTSFEASLGSDIRIPLLDGHAVTLRIHPGTPDGKTFRVPSRGLRQADGTKGDLHIRVELTADDIDAAALRADIIAKAVSAWQAHASQNPDLHEGDDCCVAE